MSLRLGVTGGIGSGKSFVCRLLEQEFGVPVYDCDARAKALMTESAPLRRELTQLLGPQAYRPDGSLNKPLLAAYVFASPRQAQEVNARVHPAVKRDFGCWATRHAACPLVVMECAILFESGFRDTVDAVLAVEAPPALRLERVRQRDGASDEQTQARMSLQLTDDERHQRAEYTLCNDGRADLRPVLRQLLARLTADAPAGTPATH